MDVQMPEMDGLEATQQIRKMESETNRHTPIIAITAHAMEEDRRRCLNAGMDEYLRKPVRRKELNEAMLRLCGIGSGPTEEPTTPTETKPETSWNETEALEAVDGDVELLKVVIDAFLGECDELMSNLAAAIEQEDLPTLRRVAHTIKGATRIFAVSTIHELAAFMEQRAAEDEPADFEQMFGELSIAIDTLRRELKEYLS